MKHRNSPDLVIFVLLLAVGLRGAGGAGGAAGTRAGCCRRPCWRRRRPCCWPSTCAGCAASSTRISAAERLKAAACSIRWPSCRCRWILWRTGRVAWYNPYFRDEVLGGEDLVRPVSAGCCRGLILRSVRGPTAGTLRQTATGSPPTPARCAAGRAGRSST